MLTMDDALMPEVDFGLDSIPDFKERIEALRCHGDVVAAKVFDMPAWLILSHEAATQVMRDQVNFEQTLFERRVVEPFQGHGLLMMQGREHLHNRTLVNPMFSPAKVRSYIEPIIEPTVHEVLDRIEGQELVDLKTLFCKTFPFTVITKLLGVPVADEPTLMQWAGDMIKFYEPEVAHKANRDFDAFMQPLVEERRRSPQDDLLTHLVHAEVGGVKIEHESIMTFLRTLYPAGAHSTSLNVASAIYAALSIPEARQAVLYGGEEGCDAVAQEAFRWQPAFGTLIRIATGTAEIAGAKIEPDEWVHVVTTAANNDPAVFPDPHEFRLGRSNYKDILTFGRGPHTCLGMHLARREIATALKALFERFPNVSLCTDTPIRFEGMVFRTVNHLCVDLHGNA